MRRILSVILVLLMAAALCGFSPSADAKALAKARTAEKPAEADWKPVLKTLHISGKSSGLDEVDAILASSKIDLTFETPEKDHFALRGEAVIQNSRPIRLILTGDEKGLCFTLPGVCEEIYSVGYDVLLELAEASGVDLGTVNTLQSGGLAGAAEEEKEAALEFLLRYAGIFLSVLNTENMTESTENYQLALIGATEPCTVLRVQPSREEWGAMLQKLLTTADSDEQLDEYAAMAAERSYFSARANGTTELELEDYRAQMIVQLHEGLQNALENVDELAGNLAQLRVETATREGPLRAVAAMVGAEELFRYETEGALESGRTDMLQFPVQGTPVLLVNTIRAENGKTVGRLRVDMIGLNLDYVTERGEDGVTAFDYSLSAMGISLRLTRNRAGEDTLLKLSFNSLYFGSGELTVRSEDGGEHVTLPAGERIELATQEEIRQALEQIGESFENADIFGAAA